MKIALHQITSVKASFEEDLKAYRQAGWTAFEMSIDKAKQHIQQGGMKNFVKFVEDSRLKPVAATGHVVQSFAELKQIEAAEAIKLINRQNVGLLFDTAHFAHTPSRLSDLDLVKGKIVAGHLNDMRNCPPEIRNVNNDRVIPGDGVLPLVEWVNQVETCGFTGWHAVEIFCEDLWKESPLVIAQRVMEGCKRLWPDAEF